MTMFTYITLLDEMKHAVRWVEVAKAGRFDVLKEADKEELADREESIDRILRGETP